MLSWDSEGLWKKAKLFMDQAGEHDHASPEFAFFASLAVECLGRSALTKIHPVLNADPRDDSNILYACGYSFAKPRSLPAHSVFIRLEKVIEAYQRHHRELCEFLALQRNAHVHTADLPYENLATDKWLARFYETVSVLNGHLGKSLEKFLGIEGSRISAEFIKTLNENILSAVKIKIADHKRAFFSKSNEDQQILLGASASALMFTNSDQQICGCPSCGAKAALTGKRYKELPEQYFEGELLMDVEYLSTEFTCRSCGLSFSKIEEIAHASLPTHFTKTESTSLHDLYEPEHYQEYDNM